MTPLTLFPVIIIIIILAITCCENRKAGIAQNKPINGKVKQEKPRVRMENTVKSFGTYSYFGGFVASTGCKMNSV